MLQTLENFYYRKLGHLKTEGVTGSRQMHHYVFIHHHVHLHQSVKKEMERRNAKSEEEKEREVKRQTS